MPVSGPRRLVHHRVLNSVHFVWGWVMVSRRFLSLVVSLGVLLSTCIFVQGQSTYGSITGSVTDPSGAAISDARVTLTNLGTAEKRVQPTGADGLYGFVNLIPGSYRVEAEKPGFKRVTQEPVVVQVQQNSKIDLALPIGQATETVEVTSETPLLQSETSSLGQVVDARKATELPLNGRNIYNLAAVAPSVIPQGNTQALL
jgi:Carboxypeptidase regulatory-like domain